MGATMVKPLVKNGNILDALPSQVVELKALKVYTKETRKIQSLI